MYNWTWNRLERVDFEGTLPKSSQLYIHSICIISFQSYKFLHVFHLLMLSCFGSKSKSFGLTSSCGCFSNDTGCFFCYSILGWFSILIIFSHSFLKKKKLLPYYYLFIFIEVICPMFLGHVAHFGHIQLLITKSTFVNYWKLYWAIPFSSFQERSEPYHGWKYFNLLWLNASRI